MYKILFILIGLLINCPKSFGQLSLTPVDSVLFYCPDKPFTIDFNLVNQSKKKIKINPFNFFDEFEITDSSRKPLVPQSKIQINTIILVNKDTLKVNRIKVNPNEEKKITILEEAILQFDLEYKHKYYVVISVKVNKKKCYFSFPVIVDCQ